MKRLRLLSRQVLYAAVFLPESFREVISVGEKAHRFFLSRWHNRPKRYGTTLAHKNKTVILFCWKNQVIYVGVSIMLLCRLGINRNLNVFNDFFRHYFYMSYLAVCKTIVCCLLTDFSVGKNRMSMSFKYRNPFVVGRIWVAVRSSSPSASQAARGTSISAMVTPA